MVYDKMQFEQPAEYTYWEDTSSNQIESSQNNDTITESKEVPSNDEQVSSNSSNNNSQPPKEPSSSSSAKKPNTSDKITKPININTAGKQELMQLKGIGEVIAQRIIDYRTNVSKFEKIEDIMLVKGIAEKKFADIKNYITV